MRYFRIDVSNKSRCVFVYTPADAEGQCVVSGKELPDFCSPLVSGLVFPAQTRIPDLIPSMTDLLTLSCRGAQVFQGFRYPSGTRFLPASIVRENIPFGQCVCVYFPQFVEAVDNERSQFKYLAGIPVHATVPVLKQSEVGEWDLMHILYIGVVCSEELKNAVEEAQLSNFAFQEIESV